MLIDRKKLLVSFDIDGTLINCVNGRLVQKNAFINAAKSFFRKEIESKSLFGPQRVGQTDAYVIKGILEKRGLEANNKNMTDFMGYYNHFFCNSDLGNVELRPGVCRVLDKLISDNKVKICLVTGNTKETACNKLEKAGLVRYFTPFIGGFGNNFTRKQCMIEAMKNVKDMFKVDINNVVHIGDTSDDIASALEVKANPIGVYFDKSKILVNEHHKYFYDSMEDNYSEIMGKIYSYLP